jgi:hypothetical protein
LFSKEFLNVVDFLAYKVEVAHSFFSLWLCTSLFFFDTVSRFSVVLCLLYYRGSGCYVIWFGWLFLILFSCCLELGSLTFYLLSI